MSSFFCFFGGIKAFTSAIVDSDYAHAIPRWCSSKLFAHGPCHESGQKEVRPDSLRSFGMEMHEREERTVLSSNEEEITKYGEWLEGDSQILRPARWAETSRLK
jgi:hypothetical protein